MITVEEIWFKGKDERGLTGEIDVLDRSGKFILAYRKAGSVSGNHYHTGVSPQKNPEYLFLLHGKVEIEYAEVKDGILSQIYSVIAVAPCKVTVQANCWHRMFFIEDSHFLELNSFEQGDSDTIKLTKE
jgi:hypothetical protein